MSESKLTVAELMARAGKDGQSTDAPRRRRRRSLEEGGISVAELTGSIPAVKEKPVESKHSAVKIDDPATPATPEKPAEAPAAKQPEVKQPEAPAKAPEKALEAKSAAQPEPKPAVKTEVKAETTPEPKKPAAQPEPTQQPQLKAVSTPKPPSQPAPTPQPEAKVEKPGAQAVDKQEEKQPDKPTVSRPAPSNDETMVLSIVDEKDPIRLTTGAFPVVPASAVKPRAPQADPAATKDAAAAADADFAAESVDQAAASPTDTTQLEALTGDMEVADQDAEEDDGEDSIKTSVFSVILMAVVGVVLGAVVFLAFEMLWERLNNWLVVLLAIAVTLGMVGLVHALRTSRDGFSMILAGIVGLVMTFGPLLIIF